ncbi:unnamed protein product, partial [Polarella glacialis]
MATAMKSTIQTSAKALKRPGSNKKKVLNKNPSSRKEKKNCRKLAKEMKGVNDQLDKHIIEENLTAQQLKEILVLAVEQHRSAKELLGKSDARSSKAKSEAGSKGKGKKAAETIEAQLNGAKLYLEGIVALLLAFTYATAMRDLGIATFFADALGDTLTPTTLPCVTFILCSIFSLSTGTSWGTMGTVTQEPINSDAFTSEIETTLAAVLGGSIWGDHCSPVSDTTILSAMSSQVSLWDHSKTQLPYAFFAGVFSMLLGYLPAGAGAPGPLMIIIGFFLIPVFHVGLSKIPNFGGPIEVYCPEVGGCIGEGPRGAMNSIRRNFKKSSKSQEAAQEAWLTLFETSLSWVLSQVPSHEDDLCKPASYAGVEKVAPEVSETASHTEQVDKEGYMLDHMPPCPIARERLCQSNMCHLRLYMLDHMPVSSCTFKALSEQDVPLSFAENAYSTGFVSNAAANRPSDIDIMDSKNGRLEMKRFMSELGEKHDPNQVHQVISSLLGDKAPPPPPKPKEPDPPCRSCSKPCAKPLRCGTCKAATYCSAACQKEDWQFHKRICKKPVVAPAAPETQEASEVPASSSTPLRPKENETLVENESVGSWYKHREWKPEEPQQDFAPSKLGEQVAAGAQSKSSASGTSAWNSAGTWEEKDMMPWWSQKLQALNGLGDGEVLTVEKVEGVRGEASVVHVRGQPKFLCDLSFELCFSGLQ